MTADALTVLVRDALGDGARILERRPAAYRSSLPVEEITVLTGDGHRRRLAAKQVAASDGRREIAAYRHVLACLDLATPAFVGARDGLLLLEWVGGAPLWQSGDLADWEAAARWLARLHAAPVPPGAAGLVRHDEARLCRWAAQLSAHAPGRADVPALAQAAARRLAALPAVLVHGEFYPANVLVSAGRIRPVDWETAGPGPGVLDLAALTAGAWPGDEPARMEAAYRDALPERLDPPPGALEDARLLISLQCRAAGAARA